MSKRFITDILLLLTRTALAAPVALVIVAATAAAKTPAESGLGMQCGKLELFLGTVQIFDATRSHVIDTTPGRKLQCGDWVSVESGSAVIRHKQGFQVQLLSGTFIQLLDPQSGQNTEEDHLTLYRGELEVIAPEKVTARVSTANARAAFKGSRGVVIFDGARYETQLVGIEGESALANRYLERKATRVKPGTFSKVDLNDHRLHATNSRAVDLKQLALLLNRHAVEGKLRDSVLTAAKAAQETRMPRKLAVKKAASRGIASVKPAARADEDDAPKAFQPVQGSDLPGQVGRTYSATESSAAPRAPVDVNRPKTRARKPASARPKPGLAAVPSLRLQQQEAERKKLLQKLSLMGVVSDEEDRE